MTSEQELELSARQQEIGAAIEQLLAWNCRASAAGSR
jgi:hypothetical protein